LHISSNTGKSLHRQYSNSQCVLYGTFHIRLKALRQAIQKSLILQYLDATYHRKKI